MATSAMTGVKKQCIVNITVNINITHKQCIGRNHLAVTPSTGHPKHPSFTCCEHSWGLSAIGGAPTDMLIYTLVARLLGDSRKCRTISATAIYG